MQNLEKALPDEIYAYFGWVRPFFPNAHCNKRIAKSSLAKFENV